MAAQLDPRFEPHRDFANVSVEWLEEVHSLASRMRLQIQILNEQLGVTEQGIAPVVIYDTLRAARLLIDTEDTFDTFRIAVDAEGHRCDATDEDAVAWSLLGAIACAAEGEPGLINACWATIRLASETVAGRNHVFTAFDAAHISLGRAMLSLAAGVPV